MNDLPNHERGSKPPAIAAAVRRLNAALDALEVVVERRQDNDRSQDNLAARIQSLGVDRSRLADELDTSLSRARVLEDANRNVAARIDGAIATIRAVLKTEPSP